MDLKTRAIAAAVATVAAFLILFADARTAQADHAIQIAPGAYAGYYRTTGSSFLAGSQTVSLAAGTHALTISTGNSFQFQVDASGNVTSLNAAAATGTGSTLTFNTTMVTIDPAAYTGYYSLSYADYAHGTGSRTVALIPGLTGYLLFITTANFFRFDVDASGNVTSQSPAAATGTGSTLQFNTITVTIDPAAYTGYYTVSYVDTALGTGSRTFTLMPGVTGYVLFITTWNFFRFDVDASGNVTSQSPAAATGTGSTLQFNTVTVTIDPGDYTGKYFVSYVDNTYDSGSRTVTLMPGVTGYILALATQNLFRFDVDASGNVTSQSPAAADGGAATLRFRTSTVRVEPVGYTGNYYIRGVEDQATAGERCLTLLPGVSGYILQIRTGVLSRFDVDALGDPMPATLLLNDAGVTRTFLLTADCGNEPPTADAGPDQSIHAGDTVDLDGTGSFDDQTASGDLGYAWSFVTRPAGSTAALVDAATATPSFVADLPGAYEVQLVVTDGEGLVSDPDSVIVSSLNVAPTADAGPDQAVDVDEVAQLDGLGSFDPDGDALTYQWAIVLAPAGSTATLDDVTSSMPSLAPDLEGVYVVALVVSDAFAASVQDEVTITAIGPLYAQELLRDACDLIAALPNSSFDAKGHRKSLCNEISRILKFVDREDYDSAAFHLEGLIERVDGCALRGPPDPKGSGQTYAADHIVDCDDQEAVYDLLVDALDALT